MSKFQDSLKRASDASEGVGFVAGEFRERWPLVAEAMFGVPGTAETPTVWRCTLNLFWEGDKLKFCLNPKSGPRVCFGTILQPLDGLDGVEQALRDEQFEWKARGSRSRA